MNNSPAFGIVKAGSDAPNAKEHLRDTGCLLLKGCVSGEIFREIALFVCDSLKKYEEIFSSDFGFSLGDNEKLSDFLTRQPFQQLPDDVKHLVRGELPLSIRISPILKRICDSATLVQTLQEIFDNEPLRLHHPPSVRASRPGMDQGLVPLHQDDGYATHISDFITVWMPLCPIDDEIGGIEIFPGTHQDAAKPHQRQTIWLQIDESEETRAPVHILCAPGDVIIFGPRLLHRSRPNRSDRVRYSIDYRFFPSHQKSPKRFYDLQTQKLVVPPGA